MGVDYQMVQLNQFWPWPRGLVLSLGLGLGSCGLSLGHYGLGLGHYGLGLGLGSHGLDYNTDRFPLAF